MSYPVFHVPAGDVVPILFATYAGSTGASATMSGLAVTDIEIYKDGSTTQRSSDAGYALLDTDGIDFDGLTGIHGFSIDTGDNTDSGFYTVGAWFTVVVSAVTVDSQTVSFIAAQFRLMPAEAIAGKSKVDVDAWLGTAAATPSVAGVPEVDLTHVAGATTNVAALATNVDAILTDTGTTLQAELDGIQADTEDIQTRLPAALVGGRIDANMGAVSADAAAADTLELFAEALDQATGQLDSGSLATGTITAASIAADAITDAKVASDVTIASVTGAVGSVTGAVGSVTGNVGGNVAGSVGSVTGNVGGNVTGSVGSVATGGITAASIAADAIGASELAADALAEIADAVLDEVLSGHTTAGTLGHRLQVIRANTAQAGAAGSVTLDASASAVDDFYNGTLIHITAGTGAGQARIISDYVGSTKVASVAVNWATNPSSDSVFAILPGGSSPITGTVAANVTQWNGSAVATPSVAGVPEVDVTHYAGATTDVSTIPASVAAILVDTGTTLQGELDGIQADTEDIQSRLPAALVSGRIDASVGAMASNVLTAAALNADAVDEILDEQVGDGTITMRQALRVLISGMAGKLGGAATTTVTLRNLADTADVIVATVDADGNRSAVTVTP